MWISAPASASPAASPPTPTTLSQRGMQRQGWDDADRPMPVYASARSVPAAEGTSRAAPEASGVSFPQMLFCDGETGPPAVVEKNDDKGGGGGEDGLGAVRGLAHCMFLSAPLLSAFVGWKKKTTSAVFVVLDRERHQIGPIQGRLVDRPNYVWAIILGSRGSSVTLAKERRAWEHSSLTLKLGSLRLLGSFFGLQSFGEILQDYGPWREPFVSGLPFMKKHVITLLKCDSPKTRLDRKFNKLLERIPFKLYHVLCSYSMQIRKLLSHYLDKQFAGTS